MSAGESTFAGCRVVAFESRMAGPMAELITRNGGVPLIAPALREIPIEHNTDALDFAGRLMAGQFDLVIFLTGVGTRFLAEAIETQTPRAEWLAALARTKVVARGPKPLAELRSLGVRVDLIVPEPNTWHEILEQLDTRMPVAGKRVAVQEYGKPSTELVHGLAQRGAMVTQVPVYRWALPEDTAPLRHAIAGIAAEDVQVVLFTAAQQVEHLLRVATETSLEPALRHALQTKVVVGSVGPTTSEALRDQNLPVDIEPDHPKMGHLVTAAAARWQSVSKPRTSQIRIEPASEGSTRLWVRNQLNERLKNSRFLKACRREPTDVTPIWLMRQAGRYMPDYRAVRAQYSFLELCKRPQLAAEVTCRAVESLGVDAAILFADILLILEPLGFQIEFVKGEGPVIDNPVREPEDIHRIRPLEDASALGYVYEAVSRARAGLPENIPLIGFSGAPFTLACYAIEGGSSRHYDQAKAFMYSDPGAWNAFMELLVDAIARYLNAQAAAGAQALQIFDSWVGTLSPADYRSYVLPHMSRLFALLTPDVPVIHFGTGTGLLLELQRDAGGQVIGLDWRVDLDEAWRRLGPQVAVQGNLDPAVLLAPIAMIESHARRILHQAGGRPGHIFNLGHGVLPTTPPEHVRALIEFVHSAAMIR